MLVYGPDVFEIQYVMASADVGKGESMEKMGYSTSGMLCDLFAFVIFVCEHALP